ncbi:leucine-rich repeat receptor-like protein kinase PXC1 [Ananas comosus]|uniref:Leucine-rich repeat receptor-like protein kinase PXC1 n=1 Tax=Ananas comosus TaxID=4615 RepID=A0A6P5GD85_ANACO|nr:leucine-rich repeat receptor-like protein kinase PXC1 [Ananas comosus]
MVTFLHSKLTTTAPPLPLVPLVQMVVLLLLLSVMALAGPTSDTDALAMFRQSSDAHGNLAGNWTSASGDACSGQWVGVGCTGGRVTSLSVPSLDLRGPLDPLSRLDQLRILDLRGNRLNGTLLPILPSLPNLKLLYLSRNELSGPIPPAIALLTRLLRVDLSDNDLRGPIPGADALSNLTRLLTLRLQNNLLSGALPDLSAALPHLADFNASNNQLSGRVPDGMRARFGAASFAGNAGLCGQAPPLPLCSFIPHDDPSRPSSSNASSSSPASGRSVVPSNPSSMPATNDSGGGRGSRGLSTGAIIGIAVGNALFLLVLLSLLAAYCCCAGETLGEKELDKSSCGGGGLSYCCDPEGNRPSGGVGRRSDGGESDGAQSKLVFFGSGEETNEAEEEEEEEEEEEDKSRRRKSGMKLTRRMDGGQRRFELEELLRASAEMVGKGSLGTVYRAMLEDGCMVAVKRLRDANPCARRDFHRYMDLIGRLRHPNLVPLRAYYYAKQEKLLIYDFLPNGTLHARLHASRGAGLPPLDWTTRIRLVLGAARGLARIHDEYRSSGIPHGNVKSANVLLDKNGVACIADFGLALLLSPAHAVARLGSYVAPEQAEFKRLSQQADVYSFGVLVLEVLTGRAPATQIQCPPHASQSRNNNNNNNNNNNKYTHTNAGSMVGASLPEWVRSVVREEWTAEVFDPELLRYKNIEDEMVAMLHVGLACVAQQPEQRPTMREVVKMIEDMRVEQSPLPEEELEDDDPRFSLSHSLATNIDQDGDSRISY